ncbi:hypothetical protein JKY72_05410 [Candidatus Gracilibacteria bacterium]|nr:hypothetical protein [Candidatus Gracilibacteria bacterium]
MNYIHPRINIQEIAEACSKGTDNKIITSLEQIPPSKVTGIIESVKHDILNSPLLTLNIAKRFIHAQIRKRTNGHHRTIPDPTHPAFLVMPGYFGPNDYLRPLLKVIQRITGWEVINLPEFDKIRPRGRIKRDTETFMKTLRERKAPTIGLGHSKAGKIRPEVKKQLREEGLEHIMPGSILIAPVSNGIRPEADLIARFIPSKTIQEMRAKNAPDHHTEEPDEDLLIITPENGDIFTSPEESFVNGCTMILTQGHEGHLQQCIDPRTIIFQTAVNAAVIMAEQIDALKIAA